MPYPILSYNPADVGFNQNPYGAYAEIHAKSPIFYWKEYDIWCFAGFDHVNQLLRDRRFGREILHVANRNELGAYAPPEIPKHLKPFYDFEALSILEREPPYHSRIRRLVNRAFVSRQIEQLRGDIETLCHQCIDKFEANGEADLIAQYATPIPVITIAQLLGIPTEMKDQLLDWSHKMVAMYQFNRSREMEDQAVKATQAFFDYIKSYAEKRKSDPRDDLLTHLIEAENEGEKLTMDELVVSAILLLNAGHEATVHGIGNGVKSILEHAANPNKCFKNDTQTTETIEELMRIDTPLHMFTRYALEDLELEGIELKQGQKIGLLLGAANHDPLVFNEPQRLDIYRENKKNVSFGAGIHFCIGAPLARLEMQVALKTLFKRLPNLKLDGTPIYTDAYHFHGLESLQVRF